MSDPQSQSGSSEGECEDDAAIPEAQWPSQQQDSTERTSSTGSNLPSSAQPSKPSIPMQKRRRVTRACDECRRKKIKCDGKQPCTHCTVYSYECTYDQPSNRRRNPAPQYVGQLEKRLQRAEGLLKTVLPDLDLNDPNLNIGAPQRMYPSMKQKIQPQQSDPMKSWTPLEKNQQGSDGEKDSMLESMVANTGLLDLDDEGNWDFHGHSSGRVFLRKMREQFGDLMGQENPESKSSPFMNYSRNGSQTASSPRSAVESPMNPKPAFTHDLPHKNCALLLSGNALDDAGAILRLVHQPSYYAMLDRVYDIPQEEFGDEENRFVPLLYSVLALGTLFARAEQSELQTNGYGNAIDQGQAKATALLYHWFRCARQMMDVTDCRDLTGLQTMLYMILFLQSSARLSTCYSYIGIALRSCIRMGLHRSVSNVFDPIETELRKRIFWIIRKLDIYVGALLGLPQMLSDDDIDQEMPIEVDDEYITREKISPMPTGELSIATAVNAHTRLVGILAKTVKYIYPIKTKGQRTQNSQSYVVSHSRIREIEQDLQAWMESLPMPFRPGEEAPAKFMRIRHLLRMAYAHIQMFLYRPFLHYVSQAVQAKNVDKRSYACAAACVSVSRNIVHLTAEMRRRGLLVGSYWFYMYTTFFAIISLIFYVLENSESQRVEDILKDAHEGRDTLAGLAARSLAADRCSRTLNEIFDQLPGKLQNVRNSTQKKRQAPSQLSAGQSQPIHGRLDGTRPIVNTNTTRPTSTSPPQQESWKRPSLTQVPSALRRPVVSNIDPKYRRGSQDPYAPSNPNSAGMQTPNSSGNPISLSPSYNLQNSFNGQQIPDLSAMMFPSADPFAYPNQPMTTLENRHFIKQENPMDPSMYNLDPPTTTGSPYDNMDSSKFGGIPPFMLQGQRPGFGIPNMTSPMSMSGTDSIAVTMPTQGYDAGGWPQQQRSGGTPGVNLDQDQLFGEDWGGWINQGYRQ